MALHLRRETEHMLWAVWRTDESLDTLLELLPLGRRTICLQEIQRFASERRKVEWLSVRVLLYTLLREDKQIAYSSQGKPYLTDHSAFISISHTKGYVAVSLSKVAPVGIDIERYNERVRRVSDRFIRPDEQPESYKEDITWGLLLHWSVKETIYKCMEQPDADLRKLRLLPFISQKEGVLQVREYVTEHVSFFTVGYLVSPDFVLTWSVNDRA